MYGPLDDNSRARQLMLNMIAKIGVIPRSLLLTDMLKVNDPDDCIPGSSGLVLKGELEGRAVALKVLNKDKGHDNMVSCLSRSDDVVC